MRAAVQPGDIVGHRFRLEAQIGRGASGRLFRATDLSDGSPGALKLVATESAQQTRRFMREARILAALSHPAIVAYRAHGVTSAGDLFLAMEWVDGPDLARHLRVATLTAQESLALVARVAEALVVVHRAGVIHRDVKPANIVLPRGELGRAKLVDFGVAHLSATLHGASVYTRTGAVIGTPGFLAPEQVRGDRVDARADLFALGCVLYECLCGRPAFQANNLLAVLARVVLEPTPPLQQGSPQLDGDTWSLVEQMLAKDPDERPRDASEVCARLRALLAAPSMQRQLAPPQERHVSPLERRFASIVAVRATSSTGLPLADFAAGGSLRRRARELNAQLEILPGGVYLLLVDSGEDTPIEAAGRAAQLALTIKNAHPLSRVVIVAARHDAGDRSGLGDALDRAVQALEQSDTPALFADHQTAGLLRGRFVLDGDGDMFHLIGERPADSATPLLLGRATPFVGRQREMGLLHTTFEESAEESAARAVVVTGDAGLGKSRLAGELASTLATDHGPEVVLMRARADPMSTNTAYAALAPALRQAFQIAEQDSPTERRERLQRRVGADSADGALPVAQLLEQLAGLRDASEDSSVLKSVRLDTQLFSEQLRAAFVAWLSAECARGPKMIIVDDLQWADVATVKLLDHALAALDDRPLTVIGLGRPATHERFAALWEGRNVTTLRLGRLSKKSSEQLVRSALGGQLVGAAVEHIAHQGHGNPFFLEELVRAASSGAAGTLPDNVLGMVETRLNGLESEARQLLRAASVFGETFWRGGVEHLLGDQPVARETDDWLATLVTREVVTAQPISRFAGEAQFCFRHSLIREACYATLDAGDRRTAHAMAAGWLESHGEQGAATVADHFELGDQRRRASDWFRRAAADALRGDDLEGAVAHAERAVDCGAEGSALGELRLLQAEAHTWMGESARARDAAQQAVALLPPSSTSWFTAVATLAEGEALLGSWTTADDATRDLRRRADALVGSFGEGSNAAVKAQAAAQTCASALARVSFCLVLVGRGAEFESVAALADRLGQQVGRLDPLVSGHLAHARATQAMMSHRHERAMTLFRTAAAAFDAAGARRLASGARANTGAMYIELGAYEQALDELERALREAESAHTAYVAALARLNRGTALVRCGQLDDGMACQRDAIRLFREQGDLRLEASARAALAEAYLAQQDTAQAERQANEAVNVSGSLAPARVPALAALAQVRLRTGRPAAAIAAAREGLALLSTQSSHEGEIPLRLAHAEACIALGETAEARETLARACNHIRAEAEATQSPALRESLLWRVPANSRVLSLSDSCNDVGNNER